MRIDDLSFVERDHEGHINYWKKCSSNLSQEEARCVGVARGGEVLDYVESGGNVNILPAIINQWASESVWGHAEIGFMEYIFDLALLGRKGRRLRN